MTSKPLTSIVAAGAFALGLVASLPVAADPMAPVAAGNPNFILVSGGCGPNGWRGPGGACHYGRGMGWGGCGPGGWRGPGGACHWNRGWGPRGYWDAGRWWSANGCPVGYWRGPWGHCRNTPYHGRLPNGGWKP